MGFGSSEIQKISNFLVKNQEFEKPGVFRTGANCNWGSDEQSESLKKGVLAARHAHIALSCECHRVAGYYADDGMCLKFPASVLRNFISV